MKYHPLTLSSLLLTALLSPSVLSAQQATLDDGTKVILNPDFTWHYPKSNSADSPQVSSPLNAKERHLDTPTVTATPVPLKHVPSPQYIDVDLKQDKPIYQLSHAGVDLVLGKADYRKGQLHIPTAISNQSQDPIIKLSIDIDIQDDQGKPLTQETRAVWQAIKRLPETYLRTQSTKAGTMLSFDVPQLSHYRIKVSLDELETR